MKIKAMNVFFLFAKKAQMSFGCPLKIVVMTGNCH